MVARKFSDRDGFGDGVQSLDASTSTEQERATSSYETLVATLHLNWIVAGSKIPKAQTLFFSSSIGSLLEMDSVQNSTDGKSVLESNCNYSST